MSSTRGSASALLVALVALTVPGVASADSTLKPTPPVALPAHAPAAPKRPPAAPKRPPAAPPKAGSLPRTGLDTSLEALAGSLLLALGVSVRIATAPPNERQAERG